MALTDKQYKELSIKEFTQAAERYEGDQGGMPLVNLLGKGDVGMLLCEDVKAGMEKVGFTVTTCEQRKMMRLHAVGQK